MEGFPKEKKPHMTACQEFAEIRQKSSEGMHQKIMWSTGWIEQK